jgi:hypothetical protein
LLCIAENTNINLKNPWGIEFNPDGFVRVAKNATGTSMFYDGNGVASANLSLVTVPEPNGKSGNSTGIVFNSSCDFNVTRNNPAAFFTAGPNDETNGFYGKIDVAGRVH